MAIKRSTVSFAAIVDGVPKVIPVGHLVEDGDPLLNGRTHLFEPVEAHVSRQRGVEEATATPGEKRNVRRPRQSRSKGEGQ